MRTRLTEKAVEKITLPPGKEREEVHDDYLPGLVLRVGRNRKSWSLMYRVAGAGERGSSRTNHR